MLLFEPSGDISFEMQDSELLRAYAAERDEAAFGELVRRYVDFVYSTALQRLAADSALAEDVTQTVFLLLARKSVTLARHQALAAWLYRTTQYVAAKAQRSERRRRAREMQSVQMNTNDPSDMAVEQMMPMLDEAIHSLGESDRLAVLLRFFMKKPMREVGLALGVSEAAAKMRVGRAVERLREFFGARGMVCSAAALGAALTQKNVNAAPATLTAKILHNLPTVGPSTLMIGHVIKTLILMSKAKATTAIIATLALLALFTAGIYDFTKTPTTDQRSAEVLAFEKPGQSPPSKGASTPRSTLNLAVERVATDDSGAAAERLRAALSAPSRKSGLVWPDDEVIQALAGFTDRQAAFAVLKSAVVRPEDLGGGLVREEMEYLVKTRAIRATEFAAPDIPEVVPFLWELFRSGSHGSKSAAFSTLQRIGFEPADVAGFVEALPSLSGSPAMRLYVPQAIAELMARDPESTAASVVSLENLLAHEDKNVRLAAACALARQRVDQDSRVSDLLRSTLTSPDSSLNHLGVDTLSKVGSKASAFVPALLDLAKNTSEDYLRTEAWRAVGTIQPSMAETLPDVARVLADDASARDLKVKVTSGTASFDDLVAALRLPHHQSLLTAAARLGEMGPVARGAIPVLLQSLTDKSEEDRERIVEAIRKIDPEVQIQRVNEQTITAAMFEARIALGGRNDSVNQFVMNHAAQQTWWTRDEVLTFAKELASRDDTIFRAFARKLAERAPDLRESLEELEN